MQEELARIIRPMASVLMKRAIRKSSSIDQLFDMLAEEIPTEAEKDSFMASKGRAALAQTRATAR